MPSHTSILAQNHATKQGNCGTKSGTIDIKIWSKDMRHKYQKFDSVPYKANCVYTSANIQGKRKKF